MRVKNAANLPQHISSVVRACHDAKVQRTQSGSFMVAQTCEETYSEANGNSLRQMTFEQKTSIGKSLSSPNRH